METALLFHEDPDQEHRSILLAKTSSAMGHWELGSRLLRFRQTGEWRNVTTGGPYGSFTEYLARGCGVSMAQAKVYLRAAALPLQVSLRYGITAASLLASLVALTPEEETMEQAMELVVEGDDGKPRKFAEMSHEERERALARVRMESPGASPGSDVRVAAFAVRDRLREAASGLLSAEQVQARVVGGRAQVEIRGIPVARAGEVFAALSKG